MNIRELISILETMPANQPVMLEIEHEILMNLRQVKASAGNNKFLILSIFPDPFEEELKKAGVP